MQSGTGNKCGSGLWPNPKKSTGNKKSASTTAGRRRIFFTYTQKRRSVMLIIALQSYWLFVWERILPPLSSKLEAVKNTRDHRSKFCTIPITEDARKHPEENNRESKASARVVTSSESMRFPSHTTHNTLSLSLTPTHTHIQTLINPIR